MRRAAMAMLGTVLGTTLMISAKLGTHPPTADGLEQVNSPAEEAPGEAGAAPGPEGSATPEALASASPIPGATPGRTPTSVPATTRPPATTPASGLKDGTFPGTSVSERYGTIKVTVVVSGGKITNVSATYPTGGETGSINAKAIPKLRTEALTAQSANIATVSGATYTSNAYKQSLQAAINAAKV